MTLYIGRITLDTNCNYYLEHKFDLLHRNTEEFTSDFKGPNILRCNFKDCILEPIIL